MRLFALFLALSLACSGGPAEPPAASPPAPSPVVASPAAAPTPPDAALADHWLVILGSKRNPTEVIPGVEVLATHPEVGAHVGTLSSSRFKNLMPCYKVTYALATPDKAAALAMSKQVRALGVDNYVKAAGAWVGPSEAIDAYCAATEAEVEAEVRLATVVDGALWLPVPATDAELSALLAQAPAPTPVGEGFAAWTQPLPGGGSGASVRLVDAASGRTQVCTAGDRALLTLGTPHFGVLQAPEPPTAPACGSAAPFERLDCPSPVGEGRWIAVPESAAPYTPTAGADLRASAEALLTAQTDWEDPGEDVTREAVVTRWRGPAGEVALVSGTRSVGPGVCGGEETTWFGVYTVVGDGLGAPLLALQAADFARVEGLVDLGADGRPEVLTVAFPDTWTLLGDAGPEATSAIAFCDCAC